MPRKFSMIHDNRDTATATANPAEIFPTSQAAVDAEFCKDGSDGFTYQILYSGRGGGYLVAQCSASQIVGYMEKENA